MPNHERREMFVVKLGPRARVSEALRTERTRIEIEGNQARTNQWPVPLGVACLRVVAHPKIS